MSTKNAQSPVFPSPFQVLTGTQFLCWRVTFAVFCSLPILFLIALHFYTYPSSDLSPSPREAPAPTGPKQFTSEVFQSDLLDSTNSLNKSEPLNKEWLSLVESLLDHRLPCLCPNEDLKNETEFHAQYVFFATDSNLQYVHALQLAISSLLSQCPIFGITILYPPKNESGPPTWLLNLNLHKHPKITLREATDRKWKIEGNNLIEFTKFKLNVFDMVEYGGVFSVRPTEPTANVSRRSTATTQKEIPLGIVLWSTHHIEQDRDGDEQKKPPHMTTSHGSSIY